MIQSLLARYQATYAAHYRAYAAIFVVYTIVNLFSSFMFHVAGTAPAVILAPQGVALAAALLFGYSVIPVTALSTLLVSLYAGNPLTVTLIAVFGNIVQPALTLFILNRFRIDRRLESAWDFYIYIAIVFFTSMIVPTMNVYGRILYNAAATVPTYSLVWSDFWIAGLVSALILTPFLVRLISPLRHITNAEWIENLAAIVVLNIPTTILTFTPRTSLFDINLLLPFCIILLWIALRGGTFFVTMAMITVSISAIAGRIIGHPANPEHLDLPGQIVNAETSLIVFALLYYFVAALEEGRRAATLKLLAYTKGLEKTVTRSENDAEAKNEFISMLGHEIRNPLASLLSSVELIRASGADHARIDAIASKMEERIRVMSRLLDDMFDISRITRKQLTLRKELISARIVIKRALDTIDHLVIENQQHLSVSLPTKDVVIDADPVRIEQVITNVLSNATKYTPAGGSISLSSDFAGAGASGTLSIKIKDSGIGLTHEEQGRIFDPYMQINPNQSLLGGIGLGLTLARNLLDMHGGTIEVFSAGQGHGSEFVIRMPARIGGAQTREAIVPHGARAPHAAYRTLVVDDNASAATTLGELLKIYGYETDLAHTGTEALQRAASQRPDVIVLDIGLPDIDGYEVARRIRLFDDYHPLLIALSGYGQQSHREKAFEAGFDHYVVKPASVKDILAIIKKAHDPTNRQLDTRSLFE